MINFYVLLQQLFDDLPRVVATEIVLALAFVSLKRLALCDGGVRTFTSKNGGFSFCFIPRFL